ncbi:hypothetical protein [Elizabethkingia anophelis]|uniref:hypothetical protein n=1 Tax=Elizabethkingia anophelis TaxID=1117645 RepID=UPI001627B02F|nr:hypothetical protein [Elizabethkingia anophelis]
MALNKNQLLQRLKAMLNKPDTKNNVDTAAKELAEAIEEYVKSGTATGLCPPNGGALQNGKIE